MNTSINELKSNVFITSSVFLLAGLLAIVFLATPLAVQAQGTTCKETGAEGTVQANCNGREIGGGWGGFLGLGNKYCCVPAAEGTYDPEKNQVECQVVACGNVRECEIGSPGQACQPPALEGSPCRDPDRERWGVCRIISEKLNTCACEFRDELGAYRDVETGGAGHLETPVVEQKSFWYEKPPVGWAVNFVNWLRSFPPGSWAFPLLRPVLPDELAILLQLMQENVGENSGAIVLAFEALLEAQDNYEQIAADPDATVEDRNTAQGKVDVATQNLVQAAEDAQGNFSIFQQEVVSVAPEIYAQMGVADLGSSVIENARDTVNEIIQEIENSKKSFREVVKALQANNVKGALDQGKKAIDGFKKLDVKIKTALDKNDANIKKAEKAVDKKVEKLASSLKKVSAQAQETQENPTIKDLKKLEDTLASLIRASDDIGQIARETGGENLQARNLVEDVKIFKEAQTILEIPPKIADVLLADGQDRGQMQRWLNTVRGAAEFSQQAANDILFDTVTVVLTVPGELTSQEQAAERLRAEGVSLTTAARAAEAEQAARTAAPKVLEVTLEPVSEEAIRLASNYEIEFINVDGLLIRIENLQASTYQTGGEDVTVTAKVTVGDKTYTATNPLEDVPPFPSVRSVKIAGLPEDLEGGGIAIFIIKSPSGKAGFLSSADSRPCGRRKETEIGVVTAVYTAGGCIKTWEDVGNKEGILDALKRVAEDKCEQVAKHLKATLSCDSPCTYESKTLVDFKDNFPTVQCNNDGITTTVLRKYDCIREEICRR